jgi:threonyl-tRNA synthetase
MIVIGEKEAKTQTVSLRKHQQGDLGVYDLESVLKKLNKEIKESQPAFEV